MNTPNTILSHNELYELKCMLRHGDIARIAKAIGVSRVTVYRCLTGEHSDRHGILKHTLKLVKNRHETELDVIAIIKQRARD